MTVPSEPQGATMDNFMNMTKEAGHTPEIQRLIDLHAVYEDAMNGQLILAPVNLEEPGKRILDSGTADGTWLRGVRSSLSAQHHYFGSDIEAELFPTQPDGITYFQQSFQDPWPVEFRNTFDVVHVRGSLAGSSPKRPVDVIKNLASLPKPGGWIQLMEMNAFSPPSNGPAMTDFARMASEVWTGIGVGDFANQLKSMLEEVGLQNAGEKRIIVELGKRAKPELQAQSVNGVSAPVKPISSVAKDLKTSFTTEQLDELQGRVRAELGDEGGRVEMIVAWAQRSP
ncbi:MAG: hypothetical protein Q9169_001639 [Polycauliona sp. 2 TL-2023]